MLNGQFLDGVGPTTQYVPSVMSPISSRLEEQGCHLLPGFLKQTQYLLANGGSDLC